MNVEETAKAVEDAAGRFISEYLSREPEYIDVVEFLDENELDLDEEEVFKWVVGELDTILQRWEDENY